MSVLDTLITDRSPGATYDWRDVNRVADAMEYVVQRLRDIGLGVSVAPVQYTRTDFPTMAVMTHYLEQLDILRRALSLVQTVPQVPPADETRPYLTVQEANDIERILLAVDEMIQNVRDTIDLGWALGTAHVGLYAAAPSLHLLTEGMALMVDKRDKAPDLLHLPEGAGQLIIEYAGQNYRCEVR